MMVVSDLLVLFFVSSVSTKPAFSIGSTFYHNSDQLVVLKKNFWVLAFYQPITKTVL